MMINRDMILQTLAQMPDKDLLDGFKTMVSQSSMHGSADPLDFDAFGAETGDDGNKPRGWSELAFEKGPDDRPSLSDRKYILPKRERLATPASGDMPHDDGAGAYDAFA